MDIKIQRNTEKFPYIYKDKKHHYVPDFIVNGKLVEIKGWHTELVDKKVSSVGKPIKVLYKDYLKNIFNYVKNKTGLQINNLLSLYENYIPEKRKCERLECYNEILVVPSKKRTRYCSISCSRIDHSQRNRINKEGTVNI